MKNPKFLLAVILLAIVATTPFSHVYSSTLTITVYTDKPSYLVGKSITVYGNLTYDGSPVQDWPVALEIQDPTNSPVVTRTLQTDANGKYNLTFKLPTEAKLGTYTVYVTSSYKGETATNNTTFELFIHNIAVVNVTPSKTVVGQGYSMRINATVENQGNYTETFNVTAYANTTIIATQTITLTSRTSTTITFTWGTTGFEKGVYTITANATTVPSETDTTDNTYTDGTVRVTMVGDVKEPFGIVNIFDVRKVAKAYGSAAVDDPETSWDETLNWDPNLDVAPAPDGDGEITIFDVRKVAKHYGEGMD